MALEEFTGTQCAWGCRGTKRGMESTLSGSERRLTPSMFHGTPRPWFSCSIQSEPSYLFSFFKMEQVTSFVYPRVSKSKTDPRQL